MSATGRTSARALGTANGRRLAPARALVLVTMLAGATAAGGATSGQGARAAGGSWEPGVEELAFLLERQERRLSDPALAARLKASEPGLRALAALTIGRIGLPDDQRLLLAAVSDADARVRRRAAFALGLVRYELDPQHAPLLRRRAREVLVPLLEDEPAVAAAAAWALGAVGGADEPLTAWLERADAQEPDQAGVAAAVLAAWWRQGDVGPAAAAAFLDAPSPVVRIAAAHALGRIGSPNAWPLLERLLADPDAEVRLMALRGLHAAPAPVAERLAPPFLHERDWRQRCEALQWLAAAWRRSDQPPSAQAFEAVLRRSLERNLHVRRCALQALAAVVRRRGVAADRLLQALSEPEPAVVAAAIRGLASAGRDAARAALERLRELDRLEPLVGAAPADEALVELAGALADEALLASLATRAGAAARVRALERLARVRPGLALARALDALAQGPAPLRAAAPRVLPGLLGRADVSDRVRRESVDRLWRLLYDARDEPRRADERIAAFEALSALDEELLAARASLLADDPSRPLRLLLLRSPAGRLWWAGSEERRRALLEPGPPPAGRDYEELARRVEGWWRRAPILRVDTDRGSFRLELDAHTAPLTVAHVLELVEAGFWQGALFGRVEIPSAVHGGERDRPPWQAPPVVAEESLEPYGRGAVGLSRVGPDTGAGRFFVTQSVQPHLAGYTPRFGRVVEGQDVVERIQPGDRMRVRIEEHGARDPARPPRP